jgi:signal transduction histidine kinase
MNLPIRFLPGKLAAAPPALITAAAVIYEVVLGLLDFNTPQDMSFTIFYLLGVAFVGWGAGVNASAIVSAVATAIMTVHERATTHQPPVALAVSTWNASTRFLLFCAAGWLTAEITRLNRHLLGLVAARTAQLHAETDKHKMTSSQLSEALTRLRAIIAGGPIIIFAVDRKGVITFEDGQALRSLGLNPGANVGSSVLKAYGGSRELMDNVNRALQGEEFSAQMEIGTAVLQAWYSPMRAEGGSLAGFTGVAVNVTEQRRLERQILEISDREQARIGQEIHDGLCQQLVSLAFDANSLESELTSRKMPQSQTAKRMARFLDQAITEARQLARGLFPIRLDAQGLPSALEELARSTRGRFDIQCSFESDQNTVVQNKTLATHLYRIAQEAINNAIKHGRASSIIIHLRRQDDQLELGIDDNGKGISVSHVKEQGGMGLHIMDYRARSVGGTLSCRPRVQGGTSVSCCVPNRFD